jgi:monoamine oxidase
MPAMFQPQGRVHFCGEQTAVGARGMEGAMESGERAALEVALGLA